MSLPDTISAIIQPDVKSKHLELTHAHPRPCAKLNSTEHLIKVHSCAPCNGELVWMMNFPVSTAEKQFVPCPDVAGTVVVAPPSSPFHVGDEVYTRTSYLRTGNARGYSIALTDELALRPKSLSWEESAAVPLSAMTAWQALFVQSGFGEFDGNWAGTRVLVTAASGSVGAWVVQLAKIAGATVVGTCGPSNVTTVKQTGADEVLNYRKVDLREWARNGEKLVDLVVDCIGGQSLEDAWWCVKDGGTIVSVYQPPLQKRPPGLDKNVKHVFFVMEPDGGQLRKITELIDQGKCGPTVDSVFRFEDYKTAFQRADSGHAKGKVILTVL